MVVQYGDAYDYACVVLQHDDAYVVVQHDDACDDACVVVHHDDTYDDAGCPTCRPLPEPRLGSRHWKVSPGDTCLRPPMLIRHQPAFANSGW